MDHIGVTELPNHGRGTSPGNAAFTTDLLLAETLWGLGLATHIFDETELAFIIKRAGVPLGDHDAFAAIGDAAILITTDMDDARLWVRAAKHKADFIVVLPDGEPWLRDRIAAS